MGKTVIVVDDSAYQRKTIADILINAGFDVIGEAKNGQQAVDIILDESPDLVTMDNIMPDMNGVEATEAIKKHGGKSKILMVSSVAQDKAVNDALARGVDQFLKKPFTNEALIDALNNL